MTPADLGRADEVRRFLDWFYNAEALQPAIRAALAHDGHFVEDLLASAGDAFRASLRPPLEERFRLLHRVLVQCGNAAALALEWEWVRRGFSLRHGLCPAQPWKRDLPGGAVLVEGDAGRRWSRRWRIELGGPHIVSCGANEAGVRCVVAVYRVEGGQG